MQEYGKTSQLQFRDHFYGVDLNDYFTRSTKKPYTFRLENEVKADGSNMIYLTVVQTDTGEVLVDHVSMDNYYQKTTLDNVLVQQSDADNWVSGQDFYINYIGSQTKNFSAGSFELRIWENGRDNLSESLLASRVTAPICTARGFSTNTCAACGASYVDSYVAALGHIPGDINGDGDVNNKDAARLFQHLSGWEVEIY